MQVTALNKVFVNHLEEVCAEMRVLGAPTIRVVKTRSGLVAMEGSHRLAAARMLRLEPRIVVLAPGTKVLGSELNDIADDVRTDCDCEDDGGEDFSVIVEELAKFLDQPEGKTYRFKTALVKSLRP